MDTTDVKNIEKRLEDALNLKANLEKRLEKLGDNPRAETFQIQLDKVNEFIVSLSEFFNSQGEDSSSLDMLDIYKGTILESIARE